MSTQLGKALKALRLEHNHRLLDMADKLNVSVAFLSAIETGRKSPPEDFAKRVASAYSLSGKAYSHLSLAANLTRKSFKVTPSTSDAQETMALLARSINSLGADQHRAIQDILRRGHQMSHDFEVPPMSWNQIEQYALKLRTDLGLRDVPFFDVIGFLERVLDNTLSFVRLEIEEDRQMPTAEGLTDPRGEFIRLRVSVYRGAYNNRPRDRWTVAHELGHLFLHSRRTMKRLSQQERKSVPAFKSAEAQANCFAAGLLIPAHLVPATMQVEEIMLQFGVSREAATLRLSNLREKRGGSMKLLPSVGELVDSGTSHVAATESRAKSSLANSLQKTEAMRGVKVTPSVPGRKG